MTNNNIEVEVKMKINLLFDSVQTAQLAAYSLRCEWDGCNGVTLEQSKIDEDEEILVAVKLADENFCHEGSQCCIYFPGSINIQQGLIICGAQSTERNLLNNLVIFEQINKGLSIIMHDSDYPLESAQVAEAALKQGYEVKVLVPRAPDSEDCNPFDGLKSETDWANAQELAEVMNTNFRPKHNAGNNSVFWDEIRNQVTTTIIMLAKTTTYPDLMMCQAFLNLERLSQRIKANKNKLSPWLLNQWESIFCLSEGILDSVISNVIMDFSNVLSRRKIESSYLSTTFSLKLQDKQLLIVGKTLESGDVSNPLLPTLLQLIVASNVNEPRKTPLFLSLDNFDYCLPQLVSWMYLNRNTFSYLLGFQSLEQVERIYGKQVAGAIWIRAANKVIFNTEGNDSAPALSTHSEMLNSGHLTSTFTKQCISFNLVSLSSEPTPTKVIVPADELEKLEANPASWKKLRLQLSQQNSEKELSKTDWQERYDYADQLLPL